MDAFCPEPCPCGCKKFIMKPYFHCQCSSVDVETMCTLMEMCIKAVAFDKIEMKLTDMVDRVNKEVSK